MYCLTSAKKSIKRRDRKLFNNVKIFNLSAYLLQSSWMSIWMGL